MVNSILNRNALDVNEWQPKPDELFYSFDGENVRANYDSEVGTIDEMSTLPIFYIKYNHYQKVMADIIKHTNYFTAFYDLDRETFFSIMIMKYLCDTDLEMDEEEYLRRMMEVVITPKFIQKCKLMARDLYTLNINTDDSGRYSSIPKITNEQAYQIVAVSFCFRIIIPLMLHFTNTNRNFDPKVKTAYIKWFNRLFMKIIREFEHNDTPFYIPLYRFVVFRGDRLYRNNMTAFGQKKMIRGDTLELYNESLMELLIVKVLYKLDYKQSCVSYIDGVIHRANTNYLRENYTATPSEIDSSDTSKDSDNSLSHAEAIEQANYKRDESSMLISDINTKHMMQQLRKWYKAFEISDYEFEFYYERFYPNEVNKFLFDSFYASKFDDAYALANLNKEDTVYLSICLKKILETYRMYHLAHLVTAKAFGKIRTGIIKNSKFLEKVTNSPVYLDIINRKYSSLMELTMKNDPILSYLSMIVGNVYETVDFDNELNGVRLEALDNEAIANNFMTFLSII